MRITSFSHVSVQLTLEFPKVPNIKTQEKSQILCYKILKTNGNCTMRKYCTAVHRISSTDSKVRTALHVHVSIIDSESERVK